jgi:hypothetical protein
MSHVIDRVDQAGRVEDNLDLIFDMDEDYNDALEDEDSPDACLIRAYLNSKGLHVRRTLDQSHYPMLPSTEERDGDQILLKRGSKKDPKIVMVDQLWLWIYGGVFY